LRYRSRFREEEQRREEERSERKTGPDKMMASAARFSSLCLGARGATALPKANPGQCWNTTTLYRSIVSGPRYFHGRVVPLSRKRYGFGAKSSFRARTRNVQPADTKPSIEVARAMPSSCAEMDNSTLATLGFMGNHDARTEILVRHIMATDVCSYDEAQLVHSQILKKNSEYMFMLSLPYQIGIASALTAGLVSFPMVFHLKTAEVFNAVFVTTDIPEPKDLETMLEIGSWTWNWMEPPLGTLSFILLCMQYARAQVQNLGIKPYTELIKQWRGERLAKAFPKYDPRVLLAYSESAPIYRGQE
jgi:hypothetical protein